MGKTPGGLSSGGLFLHFRIHQTTDPRRQAHAFALCVGSVVIIVKNEQKPPMQDGFSLFAFQYL